MNIEDYVCTIDQSKRLTMLGFEKKSIFVYCCIQGDPDLSSSFSLISSESWMVARWNSFSAYTLQELYEIMAELHETKCYRVFNDYFSRNATNYDPKVAADFIIKYLEKKERETRSTK
jgi:hypothetical protein